MVENETMPEKNSYPQGGDTYTGNPKTGTSLPCAHQVGHNVTVDFGNSKVLKDVTVAAVKFTNYGKVFYDIEVPVGFEDQTALILEIDSSLVVNSEPQPSSL